MRPQRGGGPTRRHVLGGALALAAPAVAQDFPFRPIRVIVPNAAGGVADLTVRMVAAGLAERLGQPVVIDNRPGAGGVVAGQAALSAAPDGHTLMVATNANAISASLFRRLPFDPLGDFAPVGLMGAFAIALLVVPDSPLGSVSDLLARARREPGRVNIGTISAGSTQNLAAELFRSSAGVEVTLVPYGATPALVTALLRGDVDVAFEIVGPIWGQVSGGALRPIAVTAAARSGNLPAVPTVAEGGLPGYDVTSWNALVARAGTPTEAVARVNGALNAVLALPAVRDGLLSAGVEARGGTPEELGSLMRDEAAKWRGVIERSGIEKQ